MADYLLMVLMALLWSGSWVSGKVSVASVPPEIVAFLRFLIAGIGMLGIMALRDWKELGVSWRDLPLVLGLGISGIAGYNLLFFRGLQLAPASDGAMIVPTLNPLLTLFVAAMLLGEPLTRRKLIGASISLVGQVLIFWTLVDAALHDPTRLSGDLYYVVAAVFWSAYTILGRIAARRFTPMAATTLASVSGVLMLLPFALWSYSGTSGFTLPFWGHIFYLSWGATVAGFFLFVRGVSRLGASMAAVFINLVPVFSVILASIVLGEHVTLLQIVGMLVVLGGVYMAGTRPPAATPAATARA